MAAAPKGDCLKLAAILLLATLLLSFSPAYGSGTITENFTGNQYNTQLWRLDQDYGTGSTPLVINNRLEVTVAGNGYVVFPSRGFTLIGDFDIRVDFTLIDWPASNGTQVSLGTFLPQETEAIWPQVGRVNAPWDTVHGPEVYLTSMTNFKNVDVTGPTKSGTLRLVRTGNKVEGFYWDGAAWKSVGVATDTSYGLRVGVNMWIGPNGGWYSGIPAIAAFSNIRIDYTTLGPGFKVNPAQGTMLLLD